MKVIKIGAAWCNGCLVMKPRWEKIEADTPWLVTEFYDYDESPEIVEKYHIDERLPVAIFLDKNGAELKRLNGEVAEDEIRQTLEALRAK